MTTLFETSIELLKLMAVVGIVAYAVSRTQWFFDVCSRKTTPKNAVLMIAVFGALSIFGNYSDVEILGAIANVRDLGAMIAGLLGGPAVGFTTGLIGGSFRYHLGGFTAVPCALATVFSGVFGGVIWIWKKKLIGALWATSFAILTEQFHMVLTLAVAQPFDQALSVVQAVQLPMTVANAVGMAAFAFIVDNVVRERKTAQDRDRLQQEVMQKEIRIRELEIGRLRKYSSDLEATVHKLEIVIDEDSVRREAERVMGTEFFRDLMNQVRTIKRPRTPQSSGLPQQRV